MIHKMDEGRSAKRIRIELGRDSGIGFGWPYAIRSLLYFVLSVLYTRRLKRSVEPSDSPIAQLVRAPH